MIEGLKTALSLVSVEKPHMLSVVRQTSRQCQLLRKKLENFCYVIIEFFLTF